MSIASEIQRLQQAKQDIKAALISKDCPVLSSETIDDYAKYINNMGRYDWSTHYLTFVATESGTFKFSGNSINYSLDSGSTWTSLASDTNTPTVSAGSKIMWKATGLTPASSIGIGAFSSSGGFTIEGNPMSLLYGDNFIGQKSLSGKDYAFQNLFQNNENVVSIDKMVLPATTLAVECYRNMFSGCISLTTVPSDLLPATTLAESCYRYMFQNCTSLTTAPELPATTLAESCYNAMFSGCTGLSSIKCLATDISASDCTYNWVNNVAASGTFIKVVSMTSWTTGANGIPSGWNIDDGRVVAKFNVTSTSEPTQIISQYASSPFSAIEIDGVAQPSVVSSYTFSTTGEHTVKYTLADPTSIGDGAFSNYIGLTSIVIPNSVTSIGRNAFRVCSGLTSITCNAIAAPTIYNNTFRSVKTGGTLTVPSGSSGYDTWMQNANYYLGLYGWTKVEQ